MAQISDYPTLVSAVKAAAEDDSQEFADFIDTAIGLAETKVSKAIDSLGTEVTTSIALSASSNTIAKPSDYRVPLVVSFATTAGSRVILEKKSQSYLKDYWPVATSVGTPKYYTDDNTANLIVAPTADVSVTMEVVYQGKPTALTSAAPSNYFTAFCPDVLFYATMAEMSKFMKYWETASIWEQELEKSVLLLNNESRRARKDEGNSPGNPEGGLNTLQDKSP
jgi:hypothetical protein